MHTELDLNSITYMFNKHNNYTLAGYDEIISQAFETHLAKYDHYALLKKGLAVILLATTIQIYKKPERGEKLRATVDEGGINGVVLRENIRIYHNDELVMEAGCYFALLNIITRHLSKNIGQYFDNSINESSLVCDSRTAIETIGEKVSEVIIKPSYIDALNHCNNQRYYEFVYDILDSKQLSMNSFSKIEMYYLKEVKVNERLNIYKKQLADKLYVYGLKDNGEYCFKALLYFEL